MNVKFPIFVAWILLGLNKRKQRCLYNTFLSLACSFRIPIGLFVSLTDMFRKRCKCLPGNNVLVWFSKFSANNSVLLLEIE